MQFWRGFRLNQWRSWLNFRRRLDRSRRLWLRCQLCLHFGSSFGRYFGKRFFDGLSDSCLQRFRNSLFIYRLNDWLDENSRRLRFNLRNVGQLRLNLYFRFDCRCWRRRRFRFTNGGRLYMAAGNKIDGHRRHASQKLNCVQTDRVWVGGRRIGIEHCYNFSPSDQRNRSEILRIPAKLIDQSAIPGM